MAVPSGTHAPSFPLVFPRPEGATETPRWDGQTFRIGAAETPILAYEVGKSGWTDELTTFHEETAGEDHYIDRASRQHTFRELARWLSVDSPVLADIGCSSGLMLKVLRDQFPKASVLGADYVLGLLKLWLPACQASLCFSSISRAVRCQTQASMESCS